MASDALELLVQLLIKFFRLNNKVRKIVLISSILVFFATILSFILMWKQYNDILIIVSICILFTSFLLVSTAIISFSEEEEYIKDPTKVELKRLSEERIELKKKVEESVEKDSTESVSNIIQLNLNQISEYYTINKSQARSSFKISVWALVVGTVTILLGIYLAYFHDEQLISTVSVISGIILEIISGMYFIIYNKTLKQLNYFFDKLEKVQDTMLAIELSNGIGDDNKRVELIENIVSKLIERSSVK